jgi:alpha/beta hydrolase family protein
MFAVADAVGAERFIIVGFSMAGKFGRYMAYRHPQRVLGQVLIAPPGPGILQLSREAFLPWPKRFCEPTLIIGGAADPLFNPEYIRNCVLPTTPEARAVFLPCGHEIPIEMPHETAWLLEAYFAGVQARSAEALAR